MGAVTWRLRTKQQPSYYKTTVEVPTCKRLEKMHSKYICNILSDRNELHLVLGFVEGMVKNFEGLVYLMMADQYN